jgi:predicted RNase H-like HicB family nuclease
MVDGELRGVVEREGDVYVARCWDVGTECHGETIEEAFANLREVTWEYLARHPMPTQHDGQAQERVV